MSLKGENWRRRGQEGGDAAGGREEGKNFASCFPSANLEGEKKQNTNKACVWDKNPKGFEVKCH